MTNEASKIDFYPQSLSERQNVFQSLKLGWEVQFPQFPLSNDDFYQILRVAHWDTVAIQYAMEAMLYRAKHPFEGPLHSFRYFLSACRRNYHDRQKTFQQQERAVAA